MKDTLVVVSFNAVAYPNEAAALEMAGECLRYFSEGKREELCLALMDGRIASCGGQLVAALLLSGLVDKALPRLASDLLFSARGERGKTVCYGAFSFM
jgi:hypothetical protein